MTESEVYELYINQSLSIRETAKKLKCSPTTIRKILQKNNIPRRKKNHYKNRIIETFNELTVIKYSFTSRKRAFWEFQCSCGKKCILAYDTVKSGNTKSCGHLKNFSGNKNPNFKGFDNIGQRYFNNIKRGAIARNLEFSVSIEDLNFLFIEQKQKCYFTNLDIFCNSKNKEKQTASLDRIDSSKGYIKENIRWVHKDINFMKGCLSEEKFISYCNLIYFNHKKEIEF